MKAISITVSDEYARLVPPPSLSEDDELRSSIKENGQYLPIIINQNGIILDGHHRFNACQELGIEPKTIIKSFDSLAQEKLFVIDCNLARRHLTKYQRIVLALKTKPILEKIASQNQIAGVKLGTSVKYLTQVGRVNEQVAKRAHVSHTTISKVEEINRAASESVKEALCNGSITIEKALCQLKRAQKRLDLSQRADENHQLSARITLLQGDFAEKSQEIADDTIHLIFTDPPYSIDDLPLYTQLAQLADRVLKDGGSLVTYCNTQAIPAILTSIKDAGLSLQFNWIIAIKLKAPFGRYWPAKVSIKWKPLLWFTKGQPGNIDLIGDLIDSDTPDKMLHNWEQSMIEADHVISRLTVKNQTVLDCMMGSGTTAEAALRLDRKFIGCEIDEQSFIKAKDRIAKFCMANNGASN